MHLATLQKIFSLHTRIMSAIEEFPHMFTLIEDPSLLLHTKVLKYDWDAISASTASQGTTWEFAPAGGQWRNGSTEAFVKKFRRSFTHLYQHTKLNYAELNSAAKRISNVLNNRPVSAQRTQSFSEDEDFLTPLTPNMLITGRNWSSSRLC